MKIKTLRDVGRALYGDRWQAPLARDLKVKTRTVQRWASRERGLPDDLNPKLRGLLIRRAAAIMKVLSQL